MIPEYITGYKWDKVAIISSLIGGLAWGILFSILLLVYINQRVFDFLGDNITIAAYALLFGIILYAVIGTTTFMLGFLNIYLYPYISGIRKAVAILTWLSIGLVLFILPLFAFSFDIFLLIMPFLIYSIGVYTYSIHIFYLRGKTVGSDNVPPQSSPRTDGSNKKMRGKQNSNLTNQTRENQGENDGQINNLLDSIEETLSEIESSVTSSPEDALSRLNNIENTLEDAASQIDEGGLSPVTDRIEALQDRLESLRRQAKRARRQANIPDPIPTTPHLSLSYDEIRKLDPVGSGGNADVYYATANTDEGAVDLAIKEPRMSGTFHTETITRVLEEAETWQQLDDHDHVVSVVDYGADPLPWIAMEYMDAGHLGERGPEMGFEQALWTAIGTMKAVRHAHRRGVAHLDLKPENILFRTTGDDTWDVPKVADWGLSKHLLEHSKSVEGMSPHYAAPEQFDETFGQADDITDIYQLGAVFYEMFTGRPPFEGRPTKVMRAVLDDEPPAPSDIADVPNGVDEIILRALEKKKEDRYETVVNLRNDLQGLVD